MSRLRVLITSAGRRVELLQGFRRAMERLGVEGEICVTDMSTKAPTRFFADRFFSVPPISHDDYVPSLRAILVREGIDVVIPTIDTELLVMSQLKGIAGGDRPKIVVSDSETILIAGDKRKTTAWMRNEGFRCPRQWLLNDAVEGAEFAFPGILKPSSGSNSVGIEIVRNAAHLENLKGEDVLSENILEQFIHGREFTVSTYVSRDGECVAVVPRERLRVRSGEVSQARTVRHVEIEGLARDVVERLPGARGPLNVQIILCEVSGDPYVIEVNPRFGGGDPLAWEAGCPSPEWILREHLGLGLPHQAEWIDGLEMYRFDQSIFSKA